MHTCCANPYDTNSCKFSLGPLVAKQKRIVMNIMAKMSEAERIELTRSIMRMLDDWGVVAADIVQLLCLPATTRSRHLQRYRQDTPFPDDEATITRVDHLIGIADALRTTFPRNARMGPVWMRTPHRRFGGRTPLETMLQGSLHGLISVRAELDCAYAWQLAKL